MRRITRDRLILAALVALGLLAGWLALSGLRMEGDLTRTLQGRSDERVVLAELERNFGRTNQDVVLAVSAQDLGDELAALEELVIGLQLTEGVRGVLSIFTIPDPVAPERIFLRRPEITVLSGEARLDRLRAEIPYAADLLSRDRSLTLLSVLPDLGVTTERRAAALQEALAYGSADLEIARVGIAALHGDITKSIIDDQLTLLPASILICTFLAFILFRSVRAALICAIPPVLGLILALGTLAVMGIAMDPMLTLVPTILIVLGFSDSVHLYHAITRTRAAGAPLDEAVRQALHETWPALVMTSATTALAFLSLLVVAAGTMNRLALVGSGGLALMLLTVLVTMPVLARLLLRGRTLGQPAAFSAMTGWIEAARRRWRLVGVLAILILAGLVVAQSRLETGMRIMDHIPHSSPLRANLDRLESKLPGTDKLYALIDAADPAPGLQAADIARLEIAAAALFESDIFSQTLSNMDIEASPLAGRFIAKDGSMFALPVSVPISVDFRGILAQAAALEEKLAKAGLGDITRITGYSLVIAVEIPDLVRRLQIAYLLTVLVVTALAGLFLKSLRLGLVSLVPNLIPILGVEAWLVIADRPLSLTGAIALTIAFGIAVDDTIHILNRLRLARRTARGADAVRQAVSACLAPVMTTSLVLLAGFSMTALSDLPSVAVFGRLVAVAVAMAVIADLFLYPALLSWAYRREDRE